MSKISVFPLLRVQIENRLEENRKQGLVEVKFCTRCGAIEVEDEGAFNCWKHGYQPNAHSYELIGIGGAVLISNRYSPVCSANHRMRQAGLTLGILAFKKETTPKTTT